MHTPAPPPRLLLLLLLITLPIFQAPASAEPAAGANATGAASDVVGTYLVVVCRANGPKENGKKLLEWHASLLASALNTTTAAVLHESRSGEGGPLVYSYQHVVSGFAARLTAPQYDALRRHNWCVDAIPDVNYRLMTTHTPALLGVSTPRTGMWAAAGNMGEGVIVAVIDNGVDPRHVSYSDEGMPPPPAKWRGGCDFGGAPCNRKLIGGRSLTPGEHGTHTSSTAVGAFVGGVRALRTDLGAASGMAPRAHLAFYEVCFEDQCPSTKQLIAIEKGAFVDGVDVVSISAGDDTQQAFYKDLTAVGSFSAVMSGVFVSTSAGNNGPEMATVTNCAPWVLTVAASTMGRRVVSQVKLGNGVVVRGEVNSRYKSVKKRPLVYVAGPFADALKSVDVRGKVVLCDRAEGLTKRGDMVRAGGGVGIVVFNDEAEGRTTNSGANLTIAASRVSHADGETIVAYINSTANPTASLHFTGVVLDPSSSTPAIAGYSSQGPCNMSNLGVLKPDITGPGTNIVAAVPGPLPRGNASAHTRTFGIFSGTSMAAPHLSGIAAVLKRAHPEWSPSAIKSAMMTTADAAHPDGTAIVSETNDLPATPIHMGAGLVNPTRALDPGLVYDLSALDYVAYVCSLGYNDSFVNDIIAQPMRNVTCASAGKVEGKDLNYPSFLVTLTAAAPAVEVRRTVTNVGEAVSVYTAEVVAPKGVTVEVVPQKLEFGSVTQKREFRLRFSRGGGATNGTVDGSLRWVSGKHSVRSPILVLDGTLKLV